MDFVCYWEPKHRMREIKLYYKGNYDAMRNQLFDEEWDTLMNEDMEVEYIWAI